MQPDRSNALITHACERCGRVPMGGTGCHIDAEGTYRHAGTVERTYVAVDALLSDEAAGASLAFHGIDPANPGAEAEAIFFKDEMAAVIAALSDKGGPDAD